ncbi:hypothetical protein CHL67_05985 [Prosthecochloris sp. GSB1]|uniref:sensor histidine kinase n=1 Tax=Prosthecochloris sp. GSB1 TaxID=281093 RepID=UPI000B8C95B2|nr:ATP-binding protein [Prosthecochloris sp. GSB1]ASQ90527.1 hypothetical protein CHL67_05985 [Prosthecochloris sp. GSB1]
MTKNDGHERLKRRFFPGKEHTLRHRIAGLSLLVTAVMLTGIFSLVYLFVQHAVFRHLDSELRQEASEFAESLRIMPEGIAVQDEREWMERSHITLDFDPKFAQAVTANPAPEIVRKTFNLYSDTLAYTPGLIAVRYFSTTVGTDPVRQMQSPLFDNANRLAGHILVAVPLREALLLLGDLHMVLLVTLPLALLVLFFATRFIAEKSIEPIERIIDTAENITRSNLDKRMLLPERRDELFRLARTINDLLDRLGGAYEREKQFNADASHELKTPLASVIGTLEVLIRKPREQRHYEERIGFCIEELRRMNRIVEQLLLLARLDGRAEKPERKPVDASRLAAIVIDRFRSQAESRNLTLSFRGKENTTCLADGAMLEIMLENLIGNAVKYASEKGSVTVTIDPAGRVVRCIVSNTGETIPEENLERLFDRFYRIDASRSSRIEGSGLGLSVVKKLADAQDIVIRVNSGKDRDGTSFILEVPAAPNDDRQTA